MKKFSYLWISIIVILLDQISKFIIKNYLEVGEVIKVTPKFFWLTHVQNSGAAFSISFGSFLINKIVFIIVSVVAVLLLIYLNMRSKSKTEKFAFALILGGAIGNLIDRILYGRVTDFLWCDFPDFIMRRWPVFNIADSSIVIAIVILIFFSLFIQHNTSEEK
ncbi:MAG: signal peptidase II [Candidatus Cloacimonetes bacterium]|nr:signal peptidase II [Candidatus Cloacimonadota bacterium]